MKTLVWYDRLQFIAMLIMAAAMPIGFHCGLWAGALLALTSVVKMIAQRRVGNRSLSMPLMMALGAAVLYWLLHLISVSYGGDVAVGMRVVELKAVLLMFALSFLLTDTSYLREEHFRWIFYALWASVIAVFFYFVGLGIGRFIDSGNINSAVGYNFDTRHHAYTSLYIDTAIAFVYVELSSQWQRLKRWLRIALIVSVPLMMLYIMIVNSRAGILVMCMVAVICVVHLAFFKRKWKQAIIVALLFSGFTLAMSMYLPNHANRLVDTTENVSDDEGETDARIEITKSALSLAFERPITGYGAGSYRADLVEQFEIDGFSTGTSSGYNAHNQYVETVLAVGIIGLVLLMAFLLVPLWRAWRGHRYLLPALLLTGIVCANMLFESMLERQMGLLFIGYFVSLMALLINLEENKFGQSLKS